MVKLLKEMSALGILFSPKPPPPPKYFTEKNLKRGAKNILAKVFHREKYNFHDAFAEKTLWFVLYSTAIVPVCFMCFMHIYCKSVYSL